MAKEVVYKTELVKQLAKKYRRSQQFYVNAISEFLDVLQEQIKEGKRVQLPGFGTFYAKIRNSGHARNFKTGALMKTKALCTSGQGVFYGGRFVVKG